MRRIVLVLGIIIFVQASSAAWVHRPEIGLGYTNNANYEAENKDSDLYLWARLASFGGYERGLWSLWLNYKDYFSESQNDAVNWRLGRITSAEPQGLPLWSLDFGLGGQHFTASSPGTTELGFDYVFLEAALSRDFKLATALELALEPGYNLIVFTNFDERKDNRFYINGTIDYDISSKQDIAVAAELGLVFSNQSIYSKRDFEIIVDWDWQMEREYSLLLSYLTRISVFFDRPVNTVTAISNQRGTFQNISAIENEKHVYTSLSGSMIRAFKSYKSKVTIYLASQDSKSDFENYSEFGVKGSLLFSF